MRFIAKGITLTFNFSNSDEALKFVEVLYKKLGKRSIIGEVKGSKVKVFIPFTEDYRKIVREVKLLYSEVHTKLSYKPYRFEVTTILSASNLRVAIPVQALIDALKLKGYEARLEGGYLVTNARFQYITELAEKISEFYEETIRRKITSPLRRLVTAIAAAAEISVDEVLDLLLRSEFIEYRNNEVVLKSNPENVLEKLKHVIKR